MPGIADMGDCRVAILSSEEGERVEPLSIPEDIARGALAATFARSSRAALR
jgi:hypothetical protein